MDNPDITVPLNATIKVLQSKQYSSPKDLTPSTVLPSPLDQFKKWFAVVLNPPEGAPRVTEPEAMSLATATAQGIPSVRIVLLKQVDDKGFVFFTNYNSRKSLELDENPWAALSFYWKEISRQVRVVGRVERVSEEDSTTYFNSRPVGSRVGAWASQQSSVIGEGELQAKVEEAEKRFGVKAGEDLEIPRPEFWGGWRVIPDEVEFWAGQPSRLHDRVRYLRQSGDLAGKSEWKIERLSP